MDEKEFVFIRHARGIHQKDYYLQENKDILKQTNGTAADNPFIADTGLSIEGHEQATLFGNYFRLIEEDKRYTTVFCSPIRRCIETCDHIVKGKDVIIDDQLMEVNTIQHCNNKHTKEYLRKFVFVKSNRYNLDNISDKYNPDKSIELKYIEGVNFKKFQNDLQEPLKQIFVDFLEYVETKEESEESKIDIKEVLALQRIYQFIEKIFTVDKPIVFTHGEWIQCLSKLYLKKPITRPLNCEVFKLTLKRLAPELINKITEAVLLINRQAEIRLKSININSTRTNLVPQTDYFKKYLKYKKRYLEQRVF